MSHTAPDPGPDPRAVAGRFAAAAQTMLHWLMRIPLDASGRLVPADLGRQAARKLAALSCEVLPCEGLITPTEVSNAWPMAELTALAFDDDGELPEGSTLGQAIDDYLAEHPTGEAPAEAGPLKFVAVHELAEPVLAATYAPSDN